MATNLSAVIDGYANTITLFTVEVFTTDSFAVPRDLTGYDFQMQVRRSPNASTSLASLTVGGGITVNSAVGGLLSIVVPVLQVGEHDFSIIGRTGSNPWEIIVPPSILRILPNPTTPV